MRTSLRVSAATPPKSRSHQHAVPLTQRNQEVPYCHCRAPPKRIQTQQTFLDRSESDLSLRTASRSELSERLSPTASLAATPRESFLTGICFDTTVSESTTFSILTGRSERLAEFFPKSGICSGASLLSKPKRPILTAKMRPSSLVSTLK